MGTDISEGLDCIRVMAGQMNKRAWHPTGTQRRGVRPASTWLVSRRAARPCRSPTACRGAESRELGGAAPAVGPGRSDRGTVSNMTDRIGRSPYRSGRLRVLWLRVPRPFRQQIDEGILDRAAALFARRGFAKTSVQDIADAVGLSKAGLLHHFPSKDALWTAVIGQPIALGQRVVDHVQDMPHGPERDRLAIELLLDVALDHPGLVALLLTPPLALDGSDDKLAELDALRGRGAAGLRGRPHRRP